MTRLLVVGLDCAAPRLVFGPLAPRMPNLSRLAARGLSGTLRSVSPPITVPAWACMMTGLDPGELGLYGFHSRVRGGYDTKPVTARDVSAKRVWDRLGERGHRVAALFVPPSFPPPPVRGISYGCFLTPDGAPHVFPPGRTADHVARFGPYRADVKDFRTDELERVLSELEAMVDQHFAIAEAVLREDRPDFMVMVEIATDRLHHAAFHFLDPEHPKYDGTAALGQRARALYARIDARLGDLLEAVGPSADVLVVSDHGARPLRGAFCLNDFLIGRGDLVLREPVPAGTPFSASLVDWSRTKAYADGGYAGRVHLNLRGLADDGLDFDADDYLAGLTAALHAIVHGPHGPMRFRVDRPEVLYRSVRGMPPALLVYPGDLDYRVAASVGHPGLFLEGNDRGPDGCNHDWDGLVVAAGPSVRAPGKVVASLLDVMPTMLARFGVESTGRDLFLG